MPFLTEQAIPSSPNPDPLKLLVDEATIAKW